jgi:hypothetical protein
MENLKALQVSTDEAAVLRWLNDGTDKDTSHPVLNDVLIDQVNNAMASADGFAIHWVKHPIVEKVKQVAELSHDNRFNIVKPGRVTTLGSPDQGTYPDLNRIYPETPHPTNISLNSKLLISALKVMVGNAGIVEIALNPDNPTTSPIEIRGTTKDGFPAYVLLMPMHMNNNNKPWNPIYPDGYDHELEVEPEPEPESV